MTDVLSAKKCYHARETDEFWIVHNVDAPTANREQSVPLPSSKSFRSRVLLHAIKT
jgi:hypothetical protein